MSCRFIVFCVFQIVTFPLQLVSCCHSVNMFSLSPAVPSFNDFSSFFSNLPLFSALAPRVHSDPVQAESSTRCAGGEIKIITVFPWSNSTVKRNMQHMDYELSRLQKYSGISTAEFCPVITKEAVQHGTNFAVIYRFKYLTSTCDRVRLFVRNAVSWSSEVIRARVVCECGSVVEMTRG